MWVFFFFQLVNFTLACIIPNPDYVNYKIASEAKREKVDAPLKVQQSFDPLSQAYLEAEESCYHVQFPRVQEMLNELSGTISLSSLIKVQDNLFMNQAEDILSGINRCLELVEKNVPQDIKIPRDDKIRDYIPDVPMNYRIPEYKEVNIKKLKTKVNKGIQTDQPSRTCADVQTEENSHKKEMCIQTDEIAIEHQKPNFFITSPLITKSKIDIDSIVDQKKDKKSILKSALKKIAKVSKSVKSKLRHFNK